MENVVFANGFEDHIDGLKEINSGEINPDFIS